MAMVLSSTAGMAPLSTNAGIIVPPDEAKKIIDKTAEFVANHGRDFEAKILKNEHNNPRFAFLKVGSQFYAYYKQKVKEVRIAEGMPDPDDKAAELAAREKLRLKRRFLGVEDEDVAPKRGRKKRVKAAKPQVVLEKPPPFEWVTKTPPITAMELGIIKLAALFVAKNGVPFLTGIIDREYKNPQFEFLRAGHPLHNYFSKLVTCYKRVMMPPRNIENIIAESVADKSKVIERVMKRANWERSQKQNALEAAEAQNREKSLMSQIDWQDFKVVKTITFDDDVQSGPEAPSTVAPAPAPAPVKAADDMDVDMDTDMDIEPTPDLNKALPIRKHFDPRQRHTEKAETVQYQFRGRVVQDDRASEHMKIVLSNPDAKKKAATGSFNDPLATGEEITQSIRNFAAQRQDIFGDEEERVNTDDSGNKVIWDGHTSSIAETTRAAYTSLSGSEPPPNSGVGPSNPMGMPPPPMRMQPPPPMRPPMGYPSGPPPMNYGGPPMGMPPQMPPPGMHGPPPGMMMRPPMPPPPGYFQPGPPMGMPPPHMNHMNPNQEQVPQKREMPPHEEQPPAKKQRTVSQLSMLISEEEWLKQHPGKITVTIKVPRSTDHTEWLLNGQELEIPLDVSDKVRDLKQLISSRLNGMPASKQKLKVERIGFFKDNNTMAFYNAIDGMIIDLGVKERGGRKK